MTEVDVARWVFAPKLTDPEVSTLRDTIRRVRFLEDVKVYTDLQSRHIYHAGNAQAVGSLATQLGGIGAAVPGGQWRVRLDPFAYKPGGGEPDLTLNNVEATLIGVGALASEIVIVSAHLDSTAAGEPAYQPRADPAPGADDDATGIAGVLGAARAVVALLTGSVGPRREIRFVLFNAEEANQQGSRWYVSQLPAGSVVKAVYHMDMIGFNRDGIYQYELHAGFKNDLNTEVEIQSIELAELVATIAVEVSANLREQVHHTHSGPGFEDPGQDFSDHTSFHEGGIAACLVTENFFTSQQDVREPNPDYHLREDTLANIDGEYGARIARAVAAAVWYSATR